jgi:nucleoside-diphosphate-sugar epimerase
MHVFLTGATGYLGSAVLDALLRGGQQVTAMVRDPEKAERLTERGVTAVLGEMGLVRTYAEKAAACDVVVHTAAESSPRRVEKDRLAIDTLIGALKRRSSGAPRAFIYTSGVWVLGNTSRPAAEEASLSPAATSAWRVPHEEVVLAAAGDGLRTVVVRPGIVYGGSTGIVSDLIKDGLNGLIRVIGPGTNRWSCVYDRDLADLYLRLAESPDASGVFHANDEADERVADIAEAIAAQVPMRPDVRYVPIVEARKKLGDYADALALDQRMRSPRARQLGWSPALSSISTNMPRLLEEFRAGRR